LKGSRTTKRGKVGGRGKEGIERGVMEDEEKGDWKEKKKTEAPRGEIDGRSEHVPRNFTGRERLAVKQVDTSNRQDRSRRREGYLSKVSEE